MPSNERDIRQADAGMGGVGVQVLRPGQGREDDASTLTNDELEASSNKQRCWSNFQVDDHNTSAVFESWEMISVPPTTELTSFKHILGMRIASTYEVLKDRYTGVRAIPSYSQEELASMVAATESEWTSKKSRRMLFAKHETYSQNLARRIFELPACLPSKLGALLDCRFVATNKNPCVRRDWKVVMLKPIAGFMTDEGQQVYDGGLWGMRQRESIQKWFVIIRGQNTRIREKGFPTFTTTTNPWLKIDEGSLYDEKNTPEQNEGLKD